MNWLQPHEGNLTEFVYAAAGFHLDKNRPLQIIDPEGTTTLTYYESGAAAGQLHTLTDGDGLVTKEELKAEWAGIAFGLLDRNKDGAIGKGEVKLGEEVAEKLFGKGKRS